MDILNKIGEFTGSLGELRADITKSLKYISDEKQRLELLGIELDTKRTDLDAREVEIKKVEDVVRLNEDTKFLIDQQGKASQELNRARQIFDEFVAKSRAEIAEEKAQNKHTAELNQNESKALIKERAELEDRKKNLKEQLLKEISAKIK